MRAISCMTIIVILLLTNLGVGLPASIYAESDSSPLPINRDDIVRNWTVQIVLVNYDSDIIDTNELIAGYPIIKDYSTIETSITYNIDYNVKFASNSYYTQLKQVILDNSINGSETGTYVNETLLAYQELHPDEPQRIFYPRAGRSIDGYIVEDWIAENPVFETPSLGYTLYLLNFSEFDSEDHSLEHWYDYHPEDPDTGEQQDWFRLEWDNALNPDVKFEYVGFGGRTGNIYVLDTSADQWYMRWARIWWGDEPYSDQPDYCTMDLEDKQSEVDLGTQPGIDAFNSYLNEYMGDPVNLLFFPHQHTPASYVETGLLKGLIFCMDVDDGTSVESLQWVTDAKMLKHQLKNLLPFIEWTVDIKILDITDYPGWELLFWSDATLDAENNTIVDDGYTMFYDIYNSMRPLYVSVDDPNINVFGVVFIKKNMTMYAGEKMFTGLGGNGQTVIWKSWERYYRPDEITPKSGVSDVQLHEAMHAIGMGHTWQYAQYVGDFSYSPMGYFATHNGTGLFDQNWVQSTYLDQMESDYWTQFYDYIAEYPNSWTGPGEEAYENAITAFNQASEEYEQMDWLSCFNSLKEALHWAEILYRTNFDYTSPIIVEFGAANRSYDGSHLRVWANITDEKSGVYNASVFVSNSGSTKQQPCIFNGTHWTAEVPITAPGKTINLWFEAYDYAENSATTMVKLISLPTVPGYPSSPTTSLTTTPISTSRQSSDGGWPFLGSIVIILLISLGIIVLVVIVFVKKR
jgi:hypothetical protein